MAQPLGSLRGVPDRSARQWWESRRWHYNLWLATAKGGAFILSCVVSWTLLSRVVPDSGLQQRLFMIGFQVVVYLVGWGLGNVGYFSGRLLEYLCKPQDVQAFRCKCYSWMTILSVSLPFSIPVYLAWWSVTGVRL